MDKIIEKYAIEDLQQDPNYLVLLHKYEPGPMYLITTETDVYVSSEPFDMEEAMEAHPDFAGTEEDMVEDIHQQEVEENEELEDLAGENIELAEME